MVKVGCCGFAAARAKYFNTFRVVEVQQTFYHPPQPQTLAKWRREVPPAFEFTVKAWQLITHDATSPTYRRLRVELSEREKSEAGSFLLTSVVLRAWQTVREAADMLGADKVLFQCPASFRPTDENKTRMRKFFGSIDRGSLKLVWEPRGRWSDPEIASLCDELDLTQCVDPFRTKPARQGLSYYRLHGGADYSHRYSDDELKELAGSCAGRGAVYVLFNNKSMFQDADRFQQLLRKTPSTDGSQGRRKSNIAGAQPS